MSQFDDDDLLDREFPLGDGTADTGATVVCPYCGQMVEIAVDPGSGGEQEYVEDCEVCCRPWRVSVHYAADGSVSVSLDSVE
ncbi:MAG TPA: CPXCG motif-containing cysteine-rich protein [Gemmatimonadales bacterium]|nr:CPXCG motif-containing cysteine-rich protein [Gemmatimonadales bacterium]